MNDIQEVFDINEEPLYANKSFVEQTNVIINWKNNHLKPKTLFCLPTTANETEIKRRYKKLSLYFHGDKNRQHEIKATQVMVILGEAKDYLLYESKAVHSYDEKKEMFNNIFYSEPPENSSFSETSSEVPSDTSASRTSATFFTGLSAGASIIGGCSYSADNRFQTIFLCRTLLSASHHYHSKLEYCYDYFNNNTNSTRAPIFPIIPEWIKADILSNRALLTENLLGPKESTTFNILHLTATSENTDLFVWLLNQGADLSMKALGEWSVLDLAIATQRTEIILALKDMLGQSAIEQAYQNFLEQKIIYPQRPSSSSYGYSNWLMTDRRRLVEEFIQEKRRNQERIQFILEQMPHWSRDRIFLDQCLSRNPALLGFVSAFECVGETDELALIRQHVQINGEHYRYVRDKYRTDHSVIALAFNQSHVSSNALPLFPPDSDPNSRIDSRHQDNKSFLRTGKLTIHFLCALEYLWPDLVLDDEETGDSRYHSRRFALYMNPFFIYYLPCLNLLLLTTVFMLGTLFLASVQSHLFLSLIFVLARYYLPPMLYDSDFLGADLIHKFAFFHMLVSPVYCLLGYWVAGIGLSLYLSLLLGTGLALSIITCINLCRTYQEVRGIREIIAEHTPTEPTRTHCFYGLFFRNRSAANIEELTADIVEAPPVTGAVLSLSYSQHTNSTSAI